MSPEEIAASALAGMESSLSPNSSSNGISPACVVEVVDEIGPTSAIISEKSMEPASSKASELSEIGTNAVETTDAVATSTEMTTNTVTSEPTKQSSLLASSDNVPATSAKTHTSASFVAEVKESEHQDGPVPPVLNVDVPPLAGGIIDQDTINNDGTATASTETAMAGTATNAAGSKPKRRGPKPRVKLPVLPRLIQCIPKRKEYTNHTYSDFTVIPCDANYVKPSTIEEMSFVEKIHDILSKPDYESYIGWKPNGRTFGIIIPSTFEKVVCPIYFQHKRYSSFLRQLSNHGFKHLTNEHGPNRNCYYHECFLRNMEYLCQYMPEPKDARRLIPDPINEPNFDAISLLCPVPPLSQQQLTGNSTNQQQQQVMFQPQQQQQLLQQQQSTFSLPIQHHLPSAMTTAVLPGSQQVLMNTSGQLPSSGGFIPDTQPPLVVKKMTMDRNTALAEMNRLKETLISGSSTLGIDSSSTTVTPPVALLGDKRKFGDVNDGTIPGREQIKLCGTGGGSSMPLAFPNAANTKTHHGESLRARMKKHKEKELQQQQLQQQQQTSFSMYPSISLPGQPQITMQQRQQQQTPLHTNTVPEYNVNPMAVGANLNSTYNNNNNNNNNNSIYNKQQTSYPQPPSRLNIFQLQEKSFNNQGITQQQQQLPPGSNATGYQQQLLYNQSLQGGNVRQPQVSFGGTSDGINRDNNSDNNNTNNSNNAHLRFG